MIEPMTAEELSVLRDEHQALRLAGGYRNPRQRALMEELVELITAIEMHVQATDNLARARERLHWKREATKAEP